MQSEPNIFVWCNAKDENETPEQMAERMLTAVVPEPQVTYDKIWGLCAVYVDDLLFCGCPEFEKIIAQLLEEVELATIAQLLEAVELRRRLAPGDGRHPRRRLGRAHAAAFLCAL